MALGLIASIAGGAISGLGARSAARAQERVGQQQVDLSREVYNDTTRRLSPYTSAGPVPLNALLSMYGLADAPIIGGTPASIQTIPGTATGGREEIFYERGNPQMQRRMVGQTVSPTQYSVNGQTFGTMDEARKFADANRTGGTQWQLEASPAFNYLLEQGRDTIEAGAASRGGLYSGATLQALEDHRMNTAQMDRDNSINRLMQFVGIGQSAAAGQANAGNQFVNQTGNALANIGEARAAGAVGMANAFNNGINNYLGYQQMNQLLSRMN